MVNNASGRPVEAQARTQALDDAVTAAGHAPSVLNTQPWHWRSHADTLDLSVDPARLLEVTDPDGRLAIVSCGAALHHALISLAAGGWQATVTRSPAAGRVGHLATVRVGGRIPIEPASVAHLRTIGLRYTDRRPVTGAHIDADKLRSIAAVAEAQGASLRLLRPHQAFELAAAADFAVRTESGQAGWQAELQQWAGGARPLPVRAGCTPQQREAVTAHQRPLCAQQSVVDTDVQPQTRGRARSADTARCLVDV